MRLRLLLAALISRNALGHVVFNVVVEDGVVVLVIALWSGVLRQIVGYGVCVRYDRASGDVHLRVAANVTDFCGASLLIHHD